MNDELLTLHYLLEIEENREKIKTCITEYRMVENELFDLPKSEQNTISSWFFWSNFLTEPNGWMDVTKAMFMVEDLCPSVLPYDSSETLEKHWVKVREEECKVLCKRWKELKKIIKQHEKNKQEYYNSCEHCKARKAHKKLIKDEKNSKN